MIRQLAVSAANTGVPPASNDVSNYVPIVGSKATELHDTWKRLTDAGTSALNILLWVAGLVLVISFIQHATRYITSGGDASKANTARQGLINSAIGLVFITLTFIITRAVVGIAQ